MLYEDRFDSLIKYQCRLLNWPLDWLIIKAQIRQESNFNPNIKSSAGAIGLMQLMPATAKELKVNPHHIEENICGGIAYLLDQFNHFPEIPDCEERLKFALASYNGGRGYVNSAILHAKKSTEKWQTWQFTAMFLRTVKLRGRVPDHKQMKEYVECITKYYIQYKNNHGKLGIV